MMDCNRRLKILPVPIVFFGLLILVVFQGCYLDKEEDLYPPSSDLCDTLSLSYAGHITPILESFCYTCHGDADFAVLGGNIKLEGHASIVVLVNSGALLSSITHDGGIAPPMPKSGSRLRDCNIAIIRQWINEGAPNN